jgi:hypothetical protein
LLVAAFLLINGVAQAGLVRTFDARFEGPVTFGPDRVRVGARDVPWSAIHTIFLEESVRTLRAPHAIHFADGEIWLGEIASASAGKLTLRSDLFGSTTIDARSIAVIEFAPDAPAAPQAAEGLLQLADAEPVPGALMWIDARNVAVDRLLGVLTVPREKAVRYVFPKSPIQGPAPSGDEIRLIDGSLFAGDLRTTNSESVALQHALLGRLMIPAALVRSIARHPATVRDLSALAPLSVESTGPLGSRLVSGAIRIERHDAPKAPASPCLKSMTVRAPARVRYALPSGAARMQALIGPARDCGGDVAIRITASGHSLFDRTFAPGDPPALVELDLPASGDLVLDIDHGPRLGFPCGAAFGDPVLTGR